ncbi:amidohydrolase family protein [Vibrio nitrifigilis]|uniref:Amidohydrolase family protein n=1 Tax=Vibrio nitrifigilis TaxID=2789781 RepID=A0ABS0GLK7_9VIBR|nr:amidohydrolase family protein [Vibrio nitrifigilis]MBF9003038.1 amidohydrolase family protein [Vibrio nitrifigilis]
MRAFDSLFDSHLHIIEPGFPLVENQGYLPPTFSVNEYLNAMKPYPLSGGAVVSGSFQGFDQTYLIHVLKALGPNYVGVAQIPLDTSDREILELHDHGVRAVRFNLKRGSKEQLKHLSSVAARVFEIAGWHVELYIDSADLAALQKTLRHLPKVSIDHLGLNHEGLADLVKLAECGVKVKATGFSRLNFPAQEAITAIYQANPQALMFGSDLPSTRAPQPFSERDIDLLCQCIEPSGLNNVLSANACSFYLGR